MSNAAPPSLMPGWEPISHVGSGDVGVLLSHGFTSGPDSLRHLASRFAAAGLHVECPCLAGHGTRWEDLAQVQAEDWLRDLDAAKARLAGRCTTLFALGLSLGGTLVLRMAMDGAPFRGVVAINHALWFGNPLVPFARWLHPLVPSTPAIASDIADPAQRELAYDRTPTAGVAQLHRLARGVRQDLPTLRTPLLLFRSRQDHVLPLRNATRTLSRAGSPDKELVWLERSFHVATQDFDRDLIADRSLAFFQRLSGAAP